ncbi:hypothetical protein JW916_11120 [Candidatus Sumerlaeota bacterium]|nr:hypothetical protein [Candidatus Sumerlaeota bacterium]
MRTLSLVSIACIATLLLTVPACSSAPPLDEADAATTATPMVAETETATGQLTREEKMKALQERVEEEQARLRKEAEKRLEKAPEAEKTGPGKATISWTTQSEENCYGYFVYRSESEKGPFKRINKKGVIPGAGTTTVPQDYQYVDQPLPMGKTYYYYVEALDLSGNKHDVTPVAGVVVSKPADPGVTIQEAK